jgi:general secretion pathway protein D
MLEKNAVQDNRDLDAFIITEKCLNIKAALKIIQELDQGGLRESLKIVPLEYVTADYIAGRNGLFKQIIPQSNQAKALRILRPQQTQTSSYFSPNTQILPYPAKNSIILMGTAINLNRITEFIKKYVDIPLDNVKSRLHIKDLKYAKAKDLSTLINAIIKNPVSGAEKQSYPFFEDAKCTPDSYAAPTTAGQDTQVSYGGGNRLIFTCNTNDWKRLEKLVDQLDKPQPQVAFEILVVDVSIQNNANLGIEVMPKDNKMLGKGVRARFNTLYSSDTELNVTTNVPTDDFMNGPIKIQSTNGMSLSVGQKGNLWGVAQAYLKKNNFNIITQPFLVTNNNNSCSMNFGSSRFTNGQLSKSVGTNLSNVKDEVKASTEVNLTPKVNTQGLISLDISITSENFSNTSDYSNANKAVRTLNTQLQMNAGEVLVLGGLTKNTETIAANKIPILGDIPILGNLFKSKTKTRTKTNLYIFIRPSIIKPREQGFPDEYTRMKLDYAKYEVIKSDTYTQEKDPIQRWFFRPQTQSIKQRLRDSKKGVYRPIDRFASGFSRPKSVDIKHDPYYRGSEIIKTLKKRKMKRLKKLKRT